MTSFDNSVPIVNGPAFYINGMKITNDATTPNTKLNITAGICRDSTNTFDINLGNFNGQNNSGSANAVTTINAAVNGINGLDTGSIAAAKVYYIYVIGDPVSGLATGAMVSLALPSVGPLMPFGYSVFRWVGCITTAAGGATFVLGYWSGNQNARRFTYDSPIATSVTAGTSATYAAIVLTTLVPAVADLPVLFKANWTANAAADTFNMNGGNSTGDAWSMIAPVAGGTAHTVGFGTVLSQLVAAVPTAQYKVSAVGGVAINVAAYEYYI